MTLMDSIYQNQSFLYLDQPWGVRKILWLLVALTATGLSTKDIIEKLIHYSEGRIATLIQIEYPKKLSLPNIVLCNSNQFKISKMHYHVYNLLKVTYENIQTGKESISGYERLIELAANETPSQNANEFREAMAHRMADMIVKCTFLNDIDCSSNFRPTLTDYGICYQFDGSAAAKIKQAGRNTALTIHINLESYEHMEGPAHMLNSLKVQVFGDNAYPMIAMKSFDIKVGFTTIISLDCKQSQRLLAKEGGSCDVNKPLEYFPDPSLYSKDACELNQALLHVQKECNCTIFSGAHSNNIASCTFDQYFSCALWQSGNNVGSVVNSSSNCYQTCVTETYQLSQFAVRMPTSAMKLLFNKTQDETMRANNEKAFDVRANHEQRDLLAKPDLSQIQAIVKTYNTSLSLLHEQLDVAQNKEGGNRLYKTFEEKASPACYKDIQKNYSQLFELLGSKFGFGQFNQNNQSYLDFYSDSGYKKTVQKILSNENNAWNKMKMENLYETKEQFNLSHSLYKNASLFMLDKFVELVFTYDKRSWANSPLTLEEPEYYNETQRIKDYTRDVITLNDWGHQWSNNSVYKYAEKYKWQVGNRTEVYKANSKNIFERFSVFQKPNFETAEDTAEEFWRYFAFFVQLINASDCAANSTQEKSCALLSFHLLQSLYKDAITCTSNFSRAARAFFDKTIQAMENFESSLADFADLLSKHTKYWPRITDDFYNDNIVGLKIYFASMRKEIVIEQSAYPFATLLCDTGGSLGLFVGASLLSIFELVDLIVYQYRNICKRRQRRAERGRHQHEQEKKVKNDLELKTNVDAETKF